MARDAFDWSAVRSHFPATEGQVYLDTASYGPGPRQVRDAVHAQLEAWSAGRGSWLEWDRRGEIARAEFARWIGAEAGDVALLTSLSGAAGQVAASLPLVAGANLVVGADEFQSNLFPWMRLAPGSRECPIEVRRVPFEDGRLTPIALRDAIDERTLLVAVSHVQSANGYRIDLSALRDVCRATGARLFVDATQSIGALRVPLEGIDYVATAAYKWLLSPRGTAFLYVAPERAGELVPLAPSWKTTAEPYRTYYGAPFEPPEDARRVDVSLGWPVWVGAAEALTFLNGLGEDAPRRVEERVLGLAGAFRDGLAGVGLRATFEPHETSQIVGVRVPDPEAVRQRLAAHGVVAAVRGDYLRCSFHLFNDETDVERALAALRG